MTCTEYRAQSQPTRVARSYGPESPRSRRRSAQHFRERDQLSLARGGPVPGFFRPAEAAILRRLVGSEHAATANDRLQDYYARHLHDVQAHPEVTALLDVCKRRGVARGLFTGRGAVATRRLLRALSLEARFDAVVAGDEAPPKPLPDGIAVLLQRLRRRAAETLVVGDSPLDLQAATAAGAASALALWYGSALTRTAVPARRLTSPAALWEILGLAAGT